MDEVEKVLSPGINVDDINLICDAAEFFRDKRDEILEDLGEFFNMLVFKRGKHDEDGYYKLNLDEVFTETFRYNYTYEIIPKHLNADQLMWINSLQKQGKIESAYKKFEHLHGAFRMFNHILKTWSFDRDYADEEFLHSITVDALKNVYPPLNEYNALVLGLKQDFEHIGVVRKDGSSGSQGLTEDIALWNENSIDPEALADFVAADDKNNNIVIGSLEQLGENIKSAYFGSSDALLSSYRSVYNLAIPYMNVSPEERQDSLRRLLEAFLHNNSFMCDYSVKSAEGSNMWVKQTVFVW